MKNAIRMSMVVLVAALSTAAVAESAYDDGALATDGQANAISDGSARADESRPDQAGAASGEPADLSSDPAKLDSGERDP